MPTTKTLWILEYITPNGRGHLVPFYAVDEQEAHEIAVQWASEHAVSIDKVTIRQFSHGFTVHRTSLSGKWVLEEE